MWCFYLSENQFGQSWCSFPLKCWLQSLTDSLVLHLQLLIDNINRPAPNITHLLLKFNVDGAVERTVLQPKFHYRFYFIDICYFNFCVTLFYSRTWNSFLLLQLLEDHSWCVGKTSETRHQCLAPWICISGWSGLIIELGCIFLFIFFSCDKIVYWLQAAESVSLFFWNCCKSCTFDELIIGYIMQLLYELCTDPLTCNPMMDLLSTKKYRFFVQVGLLIEIFCILLHI